MRARPLFMTNDTAMSMRSRGRVAQPVEQLRQQPAILRTVVEHRRAVTPNRTIRLHGASGTRALLARGWFSRQHSFGLYVASIP